MSADCRFSLSAFLKESRAQGLYELLRNPVPLSNLILLFSFPVCVLPLLSVLLSSFPPGAAEPHA